MYEEDDSSESSQPLDSEEELSQKATYNYEEKNYQEEQVHRITFKD